MVQYSVKKSRGRKIKKYRKSRRGKGHGKTRRYKVFKNTRRRTLGKRKGRGRGRGRRMMGGVDEEVAEVAEVAMTNSEQYLKNKINTKYKDKFIANDIPIEGFSRLSMLGNQRAARVLITNLDKWFSEKHKQYNLLVCGCYVGGNIDPTCYALIRADLKKKYEDKILFLFKDKSNVTPDTCDISSIASSTYGKRYITDPEKMVPTINSCFTFKSFISSDSPSGDSYSLAIVQVNPDNQYIVAFFNTLLPPPQ